MRKAIHIHLHYHDLSEEFSKRVQLCCPEADVFISVTSDEGRKVAEYFFREHEGKVAVLVVENVGRDILPFLEIARTYHLSSHYDVVGHFHGKKTVTHRKEVGAGWRDFLLNTLLADAVSVTQIFHLLEGEGGHGLVFAEDRLPVGWSKNRDLANNMAESINLKQVPGYPYFPVGTMFWARATVVEALAAVPLLVDQIPNEPLPGDGTVLHALERLIPAICEAAGETWCTVRRRGINRPL